MPKLPNFGGFNIQAMMKQVQQFAADTERLESELAEERIEASSGGGMVTATVNGLAQLIDVKISPEVVDPDDVEMLQDLVTSAVREALERANERRKERMEELTGGLGLPPGMNIPGL
ncbi:MAG: YbaB/EbfC family nucleoid-associated protein [Armatimonadetes bacterium]|nr:YbaB/EbfC family nucleoid-associated protein [Armatimonadota bacterium]